MMVTQDTCSSANYSVSHPSNEVLRIRNDSDCTAMPPRAHRAIVEERGYEDIDPERCWDQWQEARDQLNDC